MGLVRTIALLATNRAGAGGSPRVDVDHGDTRPRRLVLDEVHELTEGPRRHHAVQALAMLTPVSDACEVFEGNASTGNACHEVNNLTTDLVVLVSDPVRLSSTVFLEFTDVLPATTHPAVMTELPAGVLKVFASPKENGVWSDQCSQLRYSEVHAKARPVTDGRRVGNDAKGQTDVPVAILLVELGVTLRQRDTVVVLLRDAQREPEELTVAKGYFDCPSITFSEETVGFNIKKNSLVFFGFGPRCSTRVLAFRRSPEGTNYSSHCIDYLLSMTSVHVKLFSGTVVKHVMYFAARRSLTLFNDRKPQCHSIREVSAQCFEALALSRSRL